MTTSVKPNQPRVNIEMGDGYQASDRLRAALGELQDALAEVDDGAEVEGFIYLENLAGAQVRSFKHQHVQQFTTGEAPASHQVGAVPKQDTGQR